MQAADWIGGVGKAWADEWRRTDRSFAGLDAALEAATRAAAPTGPARLVDIGCGAGSTSLAIAAARPAASIVGLDLSADLIAIAEARRGDHGIGPDRCRFVAGDAPAGVAALAPVDLFFSRHGVMFFDDPVAAFARLAAAAAPAGRLVFSCFADIADNPWATETVGGGASVSPGGAPAPGPFAFADPGPVTAILAAAGWEASDAPQHVAFRYVAGGGGDPVADAVGYFSRIGPAARALAEASGDDRAGLLARITAACEHRLDGDEVAFPAAAWLWSAHVKESPR